MSATITKVMNNNCVLATLGGEEVIVSGTGVGYNKKPGMMLQKNPNNKTYSIRTEQKAELHKLIERVDIRFITFSETIVQYAQQNLDAKLNQSLSFILADHIQNAVSRFDNGIVLPNYLLQEVKTLYKNEFSIGRDIVSLINEHFNVQLLDDEAGFIAIHILNNHPDSMVSHKVLDSIKLAGSIVKILEDNYNKEINQNSIHYSRFLTHLKYFVSRIVSGTEKLDKDISDIYEQLLDKDFILKRAVSKINEFIKSEYNHTPTMEEILYLSIHIKVLMD